MTIVQDNLDRLAAYPLNAVGSIAADNVLKLRTFSAEAQRRIFTYIAYDSFGTAILDRRDRRVYNTVQIP